VEARFHRARDAADDVPVLVAHRQDDRRLFFPRLGLQFLPARIRNLVASLDRPLLLLLARGAAAPDLVLEVVGHGRAEQGVRGLVEGLALEGLLFQSQRFRRHVELRGHHREEERPLFERLLRDAPQRGVVVEDVNPRPKVASTRSLARL
jgi:hypothetical protein